ncbi:hypothetical protein FD06_GL000281 [Apilactobacillus ozensis DSM 23829 = JCM 17196]|uniref:XkdN-like protein n=1 Tax=Apilactobacillus ozensis DSM 23829 = JCM 17196 TaxID=1423781 RepID=A0A0R2B094_9LACO|nr:hypothetical protein [Apilactobacillus ozensis]KRM69222.1 hypothetical protein FD06_GL000281 [Apilactobacillus ozensis DSM 23829 = JCM 17196]
MAEEQLNTNDEQQEELSTEPVSLDLFLKDNVDTQLDKKAIKIKGIKAPFVIQTISSKRFKEIQNDATTTSFNRKTGMKSQSVNQSKLTDLMMIEGIIQPDLNNAQLQESWGRVADPIGLLQDMVVRSGDYANLGTEITNLSGISTNDASEVDQVKK